MIENGEAIYGGKRKERRKSPPSRHFQSYGGSGRANLLQPPGHLRHHNRPVGPVAACSDYRVSFEPGSHLPTHAHIPHFKPGCLFEREEDSRMPLPSKSTRLLYLLCHNWSLEQLQILSEMGAGPIWADFLCLSIPSCLNFKFSV